MPRISFLLPLFHFLASASAKLSYREFPVDNCAACPTLDHTHGDIEMAVCEERVPNTSYACVCGNFPADTGWTIVQYYPHTEGNVTRCENAWSTAPGAHMTLFAVSASVTLYAAVHLFYIVVFSGMCSHEHQRCTKMNVGALIYCVMQLCYLAYSLVLLVFQDDVPIRNSDKAWVVRIFYIVVLPLLVVSATSLGATLVFTSIADIVHPGEDMAFKRRCLKMPLWIGCVLCLSWAGLWSTTTLWSQEYGDLPGFRAILGMRYVLPCVELLLTCYSVFFMIMAHRRMLQVSRHPAPPLT